MADILPSPTATMKNLSSNSLNWVREKFARANIEVLPTSGLYVVSMPKKAGSSWAMKFRFPLKRGWDKSPSLFIVLDCRARRSG